MDWGNFELQTSGIIEVFNCGYFECVNCEMQTSGILEIGNCGNCELWKYTLKKKTLANNSVPKGKLL